MTKPFLKTITVFFTLSLIAFVGIFISSIVMMLQKDMNIRLQGLVNLFWLPLPIIIIVIDRICVRKSGQEKVNIFQLYILGVLILLFTINWIRLQFQS